MVMKHEELPESGNSFITPKQIEEEIASRIGTSQQRINEYVRIGSEAWEEIERAKAEERMSEGGKVGGSKGPENFRDPSKGEAVENVGEKVGVSGRTYSIVAC